VVALLVLLLCVAGRVRWVSKGAWPEVELCTGRECRVVPARGLEKACDGDLIFGSPGFWTIYDRERREAFNVLDFRYAELEGDLFGSGLFMRLQPGSQAADRVMRMPVNFYASGRLVLELLEGSDVPGLLLEYCRAAEDASRVADEILARRGGREVQLEDLDAVAREAETTETAAYLALNMLEFKRKAVWEGEKHTGRGRWLLAQQ